MHCFQIESITGQSAITCELPQLNLSWSLKGCWGVKPAIPLSLTPMADKLTGGVTNAFNMLGPKRKAKLSNYFVHTVFLMISFWIECENMCRSLFKCICFYTSRCRRAVPVGTLHCNAKLLPRCSSTSVTVFDFCAISEYKTHILLHETLGPSLSL